MAFGDLVQTVKKATSYPATSVTVTIDAATAGSLLIGEHFTGSAGSNAPTGFAEAVVATDGPQSDEGAIYWKIAAGGETSVQFGASTSDENGALVAEIEGPWESSPVDQTAFNGPTTESSTSTGTTGTTSQADEIAVGLWTVRENSGGIGSHTNSFVELADVTMSYKTMGGALKVLSSTGAQECTASHANDRSMGAIATFKKEAIGGVSVPIGPLTGPFGGPLSGKMF